MHKASCISCLHPKVCFAVPAVLCFSAASRSFRLIIAAGAGATAATAGAVAVVAVALGLDGATSSTAVLQSSAESPPAADRGCFAEVASEARLRRARRLSTALPPPFSFVSPLPISSDEAASDAV